MYAPGFSTMASYTPSAAWMASRMAPSWLDWTHSAVEPWAAANSFSRRHRLS